MDRQRHDAAPTLFGYLVLRDPDMGPADLIIGFGHFDLKIPRQCGALWRAGRVPRILFTGGVGTGTAGSDQPEALFAEKGRDLDALLLGEMERFLTYSALGHIAQPDIPQEVLDADRMLRK